MDEQNALEGPKSSNLAGEGPKRGQRPLTPKNRAFLQHLASGRPTLEAYRLAGYKGREHAAYQLRCDLKTHLVRLLEEGGFSREALAAEINHLNALPLDPNIKNVNFKQKLDVLRLMEKALPKPVSSVDKPKITPFKLNFSGERPKLESIDAEIVNDPE